VIGVKVFKTNTDTDVAELRTLVERAGLNLPLMSATVVATS
jgi:hypothetical protein